MNRQDRTVSRSISLKAMVLVGFGFLAAAGTQAYLQIFNADATIEKARTRSKYEQTVKEFARRGTITSSDGKVLAEDADSYQLSLQLGDGKAPNSKAFFMALSEASGVPATEFEQFAASVKPGTTPVKCWPEPIGPVQAEAITAVKRAWRADGVSLGRATRRMYPLGEAAASVVGLVTDGEPKKGLEIYLNNGLKGRDGQTVGLVDKQGNFLPMRIESQSLPKKDGDSVVLTIDSDLQEAAATAVEKAVVDNNATSGVAIVMDPHTGDILAMANYPTFDPNAKQNVAEPKKRNLGMNAAIEQRLEPGSTFKILTLAKALDMDLTNGHEEINCVGELQVGAYGKIHCEKHHGSAAHGLVTAEIAIAKSCNVAAATWARRIGFVPYTQYMDQLGLLEKTKVGLPGEIKGSYNKKEYAKPLQLAQFGFGQSVTTTPLGLAGAFVAFANGGVRMKPRLIARFGEHSYAPASAGTVMKSKTATEVMGYMEAVIDSEVGTGKTLRIPGYRLAGKTGTAQKIGYKKGNVANFVGFVPAVDTKAMILVMVDDPKNGKIYGADVAGPVFKDIAKEVIRRYNIPADPTLMNVAPKVATEEKPAPKVAVKKHSTKGPEVDVKVSR